MKIQYVEAMGFRGFCDRVRIDFAPGFTIIDGRNGTGKSTIFDAVEYALTGKLSKYGKASAAGESVADYIWWIGDGIAPKERYVEICFTGVGGTLKVRRTPLDAAHIAGLPELSNALADPDLAPHSPLEQLCATTIIRDEQIASLSLDLKETERYALLRQAIGANDADAWIARAYKILMEAKRRTEMAHNEVNEMRAEVATSARRIDEMRASLATDVAIAEATTRLREFADSTASADGLSGPARQRIAALEQELDALSSMRDLLPQLESARTLVPRLRAELSSCEKARDEARAALASFSDLDVEQSSGELARQARELVSIIAEGRRIGLIDDSCPVCSAPHTQQSFDAGTIEAERAAARIHEVATGLAQREARYRAAEAVIAEEEQRHRSLLAQIREREGFIQTVENQLRTLRMEADPTVSTIEDRSSTLGATIESAKRDLRVLDTLRLNGELTKVLEAERIAKGRLARGQERFAQARSTETTASALHDAARRAAAETLDLRLDRVLPLMTELYRRLRPHPFWEDIEYSIRGDVRRFLSLKVGAEVNPQFLFSSGQRRATGLAFLLSINLSLAWSRWKTVLLDDPVQHIDDFRAIHLAEVLAQLVEADRQVICAVEDPALADLMCRRLPVKREDSARRFGLGPGENGASSIRAANWLKPLPSRAFAEVPQTRTG